MTWTYNPETGRWEDNWDGTTHMPGSRPFAGLTKRYSASVSRTDAGQSEAERVWQAIIRRTWLAMGQGKRVVWPGLVSFTPYTRAARRGRNPRTGATLNLPARPAIRLKTTRELLTAITPHDEE